MKVNNLVQCSTSHIQTFECVRSSGVLITQCQPYYHQLSLWAPCLDDSVLTIVLQPIIFQILGLEPQLMVGSSLESWNCLPDFIPDFLSMLYNFLIRHHPAILYLHGHYCPSFLFPFPFHSPSLHSSPTLCLPLFFLLFLFLPNFSPSSHSPISNLPCTV